MSPGPFGSATLAVTLISALSGCAHVATAGTPVTAAPRTVLVTGSRIPRAVDPVTGRAITESAVRVYSAQELNETGDPSLGGALRRLDPDLR